ncbi:hypothetical protein FXO38_13536 [Capsicum annuum]|nr:hypothetical protein FXO38_13536 [Capsicum annuum]
MRFYSSIMLNAQFNTLFESVNILQESMNLSCATTTVGGDAIRLQGFEGTKRDEANVEDIKNGASVVCIGDKDSDLIDGNSRSLDNFEVPNKMLENPIADSLVGYSAILRNEVFNTMSDIHYYSKSWEVVCAIFGINYTNRYKVVATLTTEHHVLEALFSSLLAGICVVLSEFDCEETVASQALSKYSNLDSAIYIGSGENGNEMVEKLMVPQDKNDIAYES